MESIFIAEVDNTVVHHSSKQLILLMLVWKLVKNVGIK